MIVVGFKKELVMEAAASEALFAYNELYDQTNTSKSLLKALQLSGPGGVLWMNGDVVFTSALLLMLRNHVAGGNSFVAVNTARVGDEEVKYSLASNGYIRELSKQVRDGLGEAVGINYIAAQDRTQLMAQLEEVSDNDYFEAAMERAIAQAGVGFRAIDISDFDCVEVDFPSDLHQANNLANTNKMPTQTDEA